MDDLISKQAVIDFYNTQFPTLDKGVHWSRNDIIQNLDNIPSIKILTCGDAISRQAALDAMRELPHEYRNAEQRARTGGIAACQVIVEELPSVSVAEKVGHWIVQPSNKEQGERDFIWWKCSECGQVIYSETEKDMREYHAFCSRCGAKMEVEE